MIEIIVLLAIKDRQAFKSFEESAVKIMNKHGGRLISAFSLDEVQSSTDGVDEVHQLRFPDKESFSNYRSDPELTSLAKLRARAISSTEVLVSEKFMSYS